jgi:hypothetical protein
MIRDNYDVIGNIHGHAKERQPQPAHARSHQWNHIFGNASGGHLRVLRELPQSAGSHPGKTNR